MKFNFDSRCNVAHIPGETGKTSRFGIEYILIDGDFVMATDGKLIVTVPIVSSGAKRKVYVKPKDWKSLLVGGGIVSIEIDGKHAKCGKVKVPIETDVKWPSDLIKSLESNCNTILSVTPSVFASLANVVKGSNCNLMIGFNRNSEGLHEGIASFVLQDDSGASVAGGYIAPRSKSAWSEFKSGQKQCCGSVDCDKGIGGGKNASIEGKNHRRAAEKAVASKAAASKAAAKIPRKTPSQMWKAAFAGNLIAVKDAVSSGVDVDSVCKHGYTALSRAARGGHLDVAKFLIESGANVNHLPADRITALSTAAYYGKKDMVKLLLASGANRNIKDKDGYTAADKAEYNGHVEVFRMLKMVKVKKGKE